MLVDTSFESYLKNLHIFVTQIGLDPIMDPSYMLKVIKIYFVIMQNSSFLLYIKNKRILYGKKF
jgi:hypothetical protein